MLVLLAALALAAGDPPDGSTATSLDGLQQVYDQSCANRAYGAFDDVCDQLSHQLREARAEASREARRQATRDRGKPPSTSPAKESASAPAPTAARPPAVPPSR